MKFLSACILAIAVALVLAPAKTVLSAQPLEETGKFIINSTDKTRAQKKIATQKRYDVTGTDPDELIKQVMNMARNSSLVITWDLQWKYMMEETPNFCFPNLISVAPDIHFPAITLIWVDAELASETLRTKWQRYMKALDDHNQGHRDIANNAAKAVAAALNNINGAKDCGQLRNDMDAKANEVIRNYRQEDFEYDTVTGNDELHTGADVYMLK